MKIQNKVNKTLDGLESLDNRIRLKTLEKQISHLGRVIADLEFENKGNLNHRNTLEKALRESCQIYSALQKNRDISVKPRGLRKP